MKISSGKFSVELGITPFEWDLDAGTVDSFGRPAAMFWLDPSLYRMLQPLVKEVGPTLYRMLVAHESGIGSAEDYHALVTVFGSTFEEGFLAWGRAVGSVGWGSFELPLFDKAACRAVVRVRNPWELRMQKETQTKWGCPFLFGKIVGIFSLALGVNCWAEERERVDPDGACVVEFHIQPSARSIVGELEALRRAQDEEMRRPLNEKLALIEHQQAAIRAMATPILQVWDGVLALPIIGVVDGERASELTTNLLEGVARTQSRYAIIDLTGVERIDAGTANYFSRIIRSIALLGAECLVCGIRPAVAQAMVAIDAGTGAARTFATMQAALQVILSTRQSSR
jgi:rsbT co-antagonist protein RsbR